MKRHPDWQLYCAISKAQCIEELFDAINNYFYIYGHDRQLMEASWMADLRQHLHEDKNFRCQNNWQGDYLPQTRQTLRHYLLDVVELTAEVPHDEHLLLDKCAEACNRIYENWQRRGFKARLNGDEEPVRTL